MVGLIGRCGHVLDFLNDVELFLEVGLLLLFLLLEYLGTLFLDNAHFGLEGFFVLVGCDHILVGISALLEVSFLLCLALVEVEFVEHRLEIVYLVFARVFLALCYFAHAIEHFLLGLVNFSGGFVLGCLSCLDCSVYRLFFCICALLEGLFLRVHHFTSLVGDFEFPHNTLRCKLIQNY